MIKEIDKYLNLPEEYYRDYYQRLGIKEAANELIGSLGPMAEPVRYTHQLWYSKTKPVLPVIMALEAGVEKDKAAVVGAAVDVLWTLSVVVDDIQDMDETRRSKPAAWKTFGEEFTYKSAEAGLAATVGYLGREMGVEAGVLCLDRVNLGMASIKKHQAFDLSVRPSTLRKNYRERDAFFSSLPMEILLPDPENKTRQTAITCLENYYIGGQLGNDLQDLTRTGADGRLRLSDIRNGLVTIPIQQLWGVLDATEKQIFDRVFGNKVIDDAGYKAIIEMVENHKLGDQVLSEISVSYNQAKRLSTKVMSEDDSRIFASLCESQKKKFLAK